MTWTHRSKVIAGVAGGALALGGILGIGASVAASNHRSTSQSDILGNEDREWVVSPDMIPENGAPDAEAPAGADEDGGQSAEDAASDEQTTGDNSLTAEQITEIITAAPNIVGYYPDAADRIGALDEEMARVIYNMVSIEPGAVEGMLLSAL